MRRVQVIPSNQVPSITRFYVCQTGYLVELLGSELDQYVNKNLLPQDQSPFEWWTRHKTKYRHLEYLSRVFLCAYASTVYSKRLFSEAGNVYEEKRNKLLPERAESLVFLHHKFQILDNINMYNYFFIVLLYLIQINKIYPLLFQIRN